MDNTGVYLNKTSSELKNTRFYEFFWGCSTLKLSPWCIKVNS